MMASELVRLLRVLLPAAVVTLTIPSAAAAQASKEYWYVAGARDYELFIDAYSIYRQGGIVSYWETKVFLPSKSNVYSYTLYQKKSNCVDRTTSIGAFAGYRPDGTTVSGGDRSWSAWQVNFPDSVGEAEVEFVCSKIESRPKEAFKVQASTVDDLVELVVAADAKR